MVKSGNSDLFGSMSLQRVMEMGIATVRQELLGGTEQERAALYKTYQS